jgi:hypothetical protein
VIGDPGYRSAARRIAAAIAALPPVDAAAGVVEAIASAIRGSGPRSRGRSRCA